MALTTDERERLIDEAVPAIRPTTRAALEAALADTASRVQC